MKNTFILKERYHETYYIINYNEHHYAGHRVDFIKIETKWSRRLIQAYKIPYTKGKYLKIYVFFEYIYWVDATLTFNNTKWNSSFKNF